MFDGGVSKKNAGMLVAAAVAGAAAAAVATGRRWRSAADPCAEAALELDRARTFKLERIVQLTRLSDIPEPVVKETASQPCPADEP